LNVKKSNYQVGWDVRRNPVKLDILFVDVFVRRFSSTLFFVGVFSVIVVRRRIDSVTKLKFFSFASQRKIENSTDKIKSWIDFLDNVVFDLSASTIDAMFSEIKKKIIKYVFLVFTFGLPFFFSFFQNNILHSIQ